MNIIKAMKIKPGETLYPGDLVTLEDYSGFTVEEGDNGILLFLYTDSEDCQVRILGGDGVFGAGDQVINLTAYENTVLYLESGRYLQHEGEYKGYIMMYTDDEYVNCGVIQLV